MNFILSLFAWPVCRTIFASCKSGVKPPHSKLIQAAARGAIGAARIARLLLALALGVVAAFFGAADAAVRPEAFENHFGGGASRALCFAVIHAQAIYIFEQARNFAELLVTVGGGGVLGQFQFRAAFKPLNGGLEIGFAEVLGEYAPDRGANQFARDEVSTLEFALIFKFHFAGDGGQRRINVGDAGDGMGFSRPCSALLGAADDAFERGNRQALANARAAIDALIFARLKRNLLDDVPQILGHFDLASAVRAMLARHPRFLRGDGHAFGHAARIVRANFRADAVFQRSNDFAARRVIFWIGG